MRDELQNSSGAEATGGEPAGLTGGSTCETACFPTWNKVSCSFEPSHHVSYETSRLQEALEMGMMEMELGSENTWREGSSQRAEDLGDHWRRGLLMKEILCSDKACLLSALEHEDRILSRGEDATRRQ